MSERQPEDPWSELEEEPRPKPWWKTARIWWLALALTAIIGFIFSQGQRQTDQQTAKPTAPIAVVQAYTPIVQEAKAAPEPAPAPPPAPLPPPPINLLPPPTPNLTAKPPAPTRPAMLSYAVPTPPPVAKPAEPAEPAHTSIKFSTATIPGKKASPAIDDTFILLPGLIVMQLDTAIDSNLPGPILAHLPSAVYSTRGVPLLEENTKIVGKYESMKQNGVERLEATSLTAFSPNGVWVSLAGQPLADPQGRTGFNGTLDRRLFERFGGAILLDLAGSALQIVQAEVAKGGNSYFTFNSSGGLAHQILQSTINVPPVITKNPASLIALWLTEPIDFSDSYKLTVTK